MQTTWNSDDRAVLRQLLRIASRAGLDVRGGRARRSSSRFCLGVEHGDYNGTELFGVGTDRFIWMAYKPNDSGVIRLFSDNLPDDGVISFRPGRVPAPGSARVRDTWARFPFGVDYILRREGFRTIRGFDAVIHGNIPGGGMSRSASLTLNLILTTLEVNGLHAGRDPMRIIDLAQWVETDYIGSPCGQLDQIMVYFARAGMGTHYRPASRAIRHIPLGLAGQDLRIVSLDTGTQRPGLEKSTYKIRRQECDALASALRRAFGLQTLAEVRDEQTLARVLRRFGKARAAQCDRLRYIYAARQRFDRMLRAWRAGHIETLGAIFRADGIGLRDLYKISGPELETMCDIARTVPGVLGERMLGGGDKGAAGALCRADAVPALRKAVALAYPRAHPALSDRWAVHECRSVDGMVDHPLGV